MKKRFTTIMALVIALAMSMTLVAGAFNADDKNCSIKVTAKVGEQLIDGIELTLYKVGNAKIENNNLYYDLAEALVDKEDPIDLNGMKDAENKEISEEIELRIRNLKYGNEADEVKLGTLKIATVETGALEGDEDKGIAMFDDLEPGVYLVRQDSTNWTFENIKSILIAVPYTQPDGSAWVFDAEVFAKLQYRPDDEEPTTKPTTGTTGSTEPTEDIPDDDVPSGSTDDEDIDDPEVPKQELPETGMMQWPVPFMAMGGVVLFGMGYISEKKSKN